MPKAKGKNMEKNANSGEEVEQQYTSFDDVANKLTADFNSKFGQMEKAIEALTATVTAKPPDRQAEKLPFVPVYDEPQTRSKAARKSSGEVPAQASVNLVEHQPSTSTQLHTQGSATSAMNAENLPLSQPRDETAAIFSATSNKNNNNNMATWLTDQARRIRPAPMANALPLSSRDIRQTDDIEAQVSQILATTAHHLTAGKQTPGEFPFKYVRRGHDMKRPSVNSLSLQEHLWGITRMIRDELIPQHIKPYLYLHLEDILEDACDYEWSSAVRPWSEECFGMVAERRLAWEDSSRVQLLRMSMSRTSTARINQARDLGNFQHRQRQGFQQTPHDQLRGGPPCPDFNSERGCQHQSGHVVSGRRMIHICAYCLNNTASTNTHSEARCRTKQKHANYHFQ